MFASGYGMAQSLPDELSDMVNTHPQINSKIKAIQSANSSIDAAYGDYLPQVKLTSDAGPEYTDSIDRLTTEGKPFLRGTTGESAMTVTQHLYNGDLTDANVSVARAGKAISEADLRTTRQNILLDGTKAYISVLEYWHLIQLATQNVHNVQDQLNLEDERIAKGAGMSLDALTAKQQLQTAKESRVAFEGQFRAAVATYTRIFGHPPSVATMVEPVAPIDMLAENMEDAVASAQANNPSVENALRVIQQDQEKIRVAEAGFWPTLDLVGKSDFTHDKLALNNDRKEWSVLLNISWDLFSGFKTQSQVAQASYDHGAAMDLHLNTIRNVSEQVRTSWEKLTTARERLGLLENASNLAEEVLSSTKKLHAAGKENIFNVLDADNRLNDAHIKYAQAYYDMISASYEVLNAMGQLEAEQVAQAQQSNFGLSFRPPDFLIKNP